MTAVKNKRIVIGITVAAGIALLGSAAVFGLPDPLKKQEPVAMIYEAEVGQLTGTVVSQEAEGFSGTGFVTDFTDEQDQLTMQVEVPKTALYNVWVSYRSPNGNKVAGLTLNEEPHGELVLQPIERFTELKAGKMLLREGSNTISLTRGWGYYDIDYIKLQKTKPKVKHQVTDQLVNPNASAEAKKLMKYLVKNYGKSMLSGQTGLDNVSWIEEVTGKKPAIVGFDLIDYSPTRAEHGAVSYEVEKAIGWHKQGGITTFLWHWNAPSGLIDETGKEWWRGFYADSVTFNLEKALDDPESEQYKLLISDIDAIAEQLKRLRDAHIPVLFRPLHEAEGGWFWWGARGPEPAKQLYRIVYDRLVNKHELNNLIWIWNSVLPEWYPGDDVVDIVSVDSYPAPGDHSPVINHYDNLAALVKDKKLVALTENGSIPDPDLMKAYGAKWSWFVTWQDEYLTDGKHNSQDLLKKIYNHPEVTTLDELPDLFGMKKEADKED
ncbi:glycosyl hydrolase [Paenibacillus sp. LHD-38]|uniref:glycosyl hydrolase n=1 Tax=Paenibacillus sp. LHD-38 TaxID=3072143 RepID=UPI00280ED83E|nr:glycosyl hydrolase [Paenibacillus sp. LHD-38]MDQ8737077.1 glycosyl hydrolase [Paenibacillus sp. LHD-38]